MSSASFAPPRRKIVTYGKAKKTQSNLFNLDEEDTAHTKRQRNEATTYAVKHRTTTHGREAATPQKLKTFQTKETDRVASDLLTPPEETYTSTKDLLPTKGSPNSAPGKSANAFVEPLRAPAPVKDIYDFSSSDEGNKPNGASKPRKLNVNRPISKSETKNTQSKTPRVATQPNVRPKAPAAKLESERWEVKRKKPLTGNTLVKSTSAARNDRRSQDTSIYDTTLSEDGSRHRKGVARKQRSVRSPASPSRQLAEEALDYAMRSLSNTPQKPIAPTPNKGQALPTISTKTSKEPAVKPSPALKSPLRAEKPTKMYGRRQLAARNTVPPLSKGQSSPAALQIPIRVGQRTPQTKTQPRSPISHDIIGDQTLQSVPFRSSTPSNDISGSPMSVETRGSVTPRQRQLWSDLLNTKDENVTPGRIGFDELKLSDKTIKRKLGHDVNLQSTADTPRPGKKRLIDHLKQARQAENEDTEMEDLSSSPSRSAPSPAKDQELLNRPPPRLQKQSSSSASTMVGNAGLRRTYAKQRSYLEESMVDGADVLASFSLESPVSAKPVVSSWSQPELFTSSQKSTFDLPEDEEEDDGPGMKSIHELRAAGAARRLKNDVDALFEDLEQSANISLSSKRSAMLNLAIRLADKDFAGKLLAHGLSHRLFTRVSEGYGSDGVLGFAFASAVGFILLVDRSPTVLEDIRTSGTVTALSDLLMHDKDVVKIAKERRTNMSRIAQGTVIKLHENVRKSALWAGAPPTEVSPQLVALRGLEMSTRALRKGGDRQEILDSSSLRRVLNIAKHCISSSASGSVSSFDQRCVYFALSIALDTMLGESASTLWGGESHELLRDMLPTFLDIPPRFGEKIELVATKLCLNVTNNDAGTSEFFSTTDIVHALTRSIDNRFKLVVSPSDSSEHGVTLDHLILGLGAMINLAECSAAAREAIIADDDVLLNALVRTYLDGQKRAAEAESMEETNVNVAYGYLSVLLGNLCQDVRIRRKVRTRLPKGDLSTLKLSLVEFVNVQMIASKHFSSDGEGQEVWSNYTERLRNVVERLKQYEQTGE